MLDSWDARLRVLLDHGGDGKLRIGDEIVETELAIYSFGEDGVDDAGNGDDRASWHERPLRRYPAQKGRDPRISIGGIGLVAILLWALWRERKREEGPGQQPAC